MPEQKEKVKGVVVKLKIRPWGRILDKDLSTYTGNRTELNIRTHSISVAVADLKLMLSTETQLKTHFSCFLRRISSLKPPTPSTSANERLIVLHEMTQRILMHRLKWMFSEILRHSFQHPKHVSNWQGREWMAFVSEFLSLVSHLKELNRNVTQPVNAA